MCHLHGKLARKIVNPCPNTLLQREGEYTGSEENSWILPNSKIYELSKLGYYEKPNNPLEWAFHGPHDPSGSCSESGGLRELLPTASNFPGSCWAEEIPDLRIIVKICGVLKGKHFFRKGLYTKAPNWHFTIPELSWNSSEHKFRLFWWEVSPELKLGGSLDGWKVLQWFQQISDLEGSGSSSSQLDWGESTSKQFPEELNPTWELEKGDWFYYILFVWGSVRGKTPRILSWKLCQCSPGPLLTHINNSELTRFTQFSGLIGTPKSFRVSLWHLLMWAEKRGMDAGISKLHHRILQSKAAMI